MAIGSVCDSEDDDWLLPFSIESGNPSDTTKSLLGIRRSPSPDELATNFEESSTAKAQLDYGKGEVRAVQRNLVLSFDLGSAASFHRDNVEAQSSSEGNQLAQPEQRLLESASDSVTSEPDQRPTAESDSPTEALPNDDLISQKQGFTGDLVSHPIDDQLDTPHRPENITGSGRNLRPRTYQQLHTYEYEHAKYVLECKAAGIKPVRFDGNRYREMDSNDRDFVPARSYKNVLANESGYGDNSIVEPDMASTTSNSPPVGQTSAKRKRPSRVMRFKDPLQIERPLLENQVRTTDDEPDVFDFLDEHWQGEHLRVESPSSPDTEGHSLSTNGILRKSFISLIDDTTDNEASDSCESFDSDTQARARFAKKLKGVLPPSFLLQTQDRTHSRIKQKIAEEHQRSKDISRVAVKGLARKKLSAQPFTVLSESEEEVALLQQKFVMSGGRAILSSQTHEVTQDLPKTVYENQEYEDDDDEEEGEEDTVMEDHRDFDRMLPSAGRASHKIKKSRSIVRPKITDSTRRPQLNLLTLVAKRPREELSRELRLGCRRPRIKGGRGVLSSRHKVLDFHDNASDEPLPIDLDSDAVSAMTSVRQSVNSSLTKHLRTTNLTTQRKMGRKRMNLCSTKDNVQGQIKQRIKTGIQSKLPYGPTNVISQVRSSSIRLPSSLPALLPSRPSRASSSRSETSVNTFSIEDNDDEIDAKSKTKSMASKNPHHFTVRSHATAQSRPETGYKSQSFHSRSFQANLEHESGRFANPTMKEPRSRSKVKNSKSNYLARFDRIVNLFGQEESIATKVSSWQYNKSEPIGDMKKMQDMLPNAFKPSKISRKATAVRRNASKPNTLQITLTHRNPENELQSSSTNFSFNGSLKSQKLDSDVFFGPSTFIGTLGLAKLLHHEIAPEVTRTCYVANRQLRSDHEPMLAIAYGFSFVSTVLDNVIGADRADETSDSSIYEFLTFASGFVDAEPLRLSLNYLDELRGRLLSGSCILPTNKYLTWLTLFHLVASIRLHSVKGVDQLLDNRQVSGELQNTIAYLLRIGTASILCTLKHQCRQPQKFQGIGASMQEGLLELWTVLYHVCHATGEPLWARVNTFLALSTTENVDRCEDSWITIFELMPVTQFDSYGRASRQMEPNWKAVEKLSFRAFNLYDADSTSSLSTKDTYIWVILRRLHELISVWHWSHCSVLLGHGRSGGILYDFFFQILHLSSLKSEKIQIGQLASFLKEIDLDTALTCRDSTSESSFEIFLKLVCLGLHQYINNIETCPGDLERIKRRGIGVVDKFATLGRLNYPATQAIERHVVGEIQNRYSLEIAVYWAAGAWKDRGVSKLIQASREALPNSHLILRTIQTQAWEIVTKLQLRRNEEEFMQTSTEWITAIVQTTASDVLQFRHQSRLVQANAKSQARINQNVKRCLESLTSAFVALHHVLSSQNASTTPKRVYLLWSNSILKPFLQLHESFMDASRTISLTRSVFTVVDLLLKLASHSAEESESQDYGFVELSQDDSDLIDYDDLVNAKLRELLALIFKFLTNLTSKDIVTTTQKVLAKYGIESFASAIRCLRRRQNIPWFQFFDSHGEYSWHRLLDNPIKAVMLPYLLAILVEKEPSFYDDMQSFILRSWLESIVQLDLRDSVAVFTTVLFNKGDCQLFRDVSLLGMKPGSVVVSSTVLDAERTTLVVGAIRTLGTLTNDLKGKTLGLTDRVQLSTRLLQSLKLSWGAIKRTDLQKVSRYAGLIRTVLAALYQYCHHLLKLLDQDAAATLSWLQDSSNVPQIRNDFSADTFRAFAVDDLRRKGLEIALTLVARCDADLLDGRNAMPLFLSRALSNNPLELSQPPSWDHSTARLRTFVVKQVLGSFLQLSSEMPSAQLYIAILSESLRQVYENLLDDSWAGQEVYLASLSQECRDILAQFTTSLGSFTGTLQSTERSLARLAPSNMNSVDATGTMGANQSAGSVPGASPWPSILLAIRTNLQNNWAVTEAGLYHSKRKVTVPFPSDPLEHQGPVASNDDGGHNVFEGAVGGCVALCDLYL
ncbi:protein of unknown function [Taphrina deformans PYCC 5710]|uniref:Mus7/MMS22 family protein n=1 Tax=Taphrina deformans (strain PYCC 5710 / ATCC 11124 / CBS 356.35 / IMI 108563 / JCM 9778 / NBRC 8474) TaxID=1097556 RepID=R4XMX1_TAPDE|nr:protein of unknown function [Taphrina deformans PYCC 5710]|eukprot:CCG84634.1 protein of unknown function [Taphrina deformans PYCC 5710]